MAAWISRRIGLESARAAILDGEVVPDDAVLAFDRGVALASLDERLEFTALGDFDLVAHERTVNRFTHASRGLRDALPTVIPAEVTRLRRFNPNAPSGQMGALRRQLERQRGGMSVRGLMQNYGDLITQIMPCTLMSPESVARFFPARRDLFDVVVFDEDTPYALIAEVEPDVAIGQTMPPAQNVGCNGPGSDYGLPATRAINTLCLGR